MVLRHRLVASDLAQVIDASNREQAEDRLADKDEVPRREEREVPDPDVVLYVMITLF